jgi:hypothetical protein
MNLKISVYGYLMAFALLACQSQKSPEKNSQVADIGFSIQATLPI